MSTSPGLPLSPPRRRCPPSRWRQLTSLPPLMPPARSPPLSRAPPTPPGWRCAPDDAVAARMELLPRRYRELPFPLAASSMGALARL
jgi:hypothetical protein